MNRDNLKLLMGLCGIKAMQMTSQLKHCHQYSTTTHKELFHKNIIRLKYMGSREKKDRVQSRKSRGKRVGVKRICQIKLDIFIDKAYFLIE
jgi:hypothetical protein